MNLSTGFRDLKNRAAAPRPASLAPNYVIGRVHLAISVTVRSASRGDRITKCFLPRGVIISFNGSVLVVIAEQAGWQNCIGNFQARRLCRQILAT